MTKINLNGRMWSESDNVGKMMITKLGWQKGQGLGKQGQGTTTHVKVSLKTGRDGIGMKNGTTNNCGLLQTLDYDMLLKTKYAEANGNNVKEDIPRSMSRAKFGRAVRPDFFKPLNNDDWTKILGSDKNNKETELPIEKNVAKSEAIDSKFVTKNVNISEYFEMQMRQRLEKLKNAKTNSVDIKGEDGIYIKESNLSAISDIDYVTDEQKPKNKKFKAKNENQEIIDDICFEEKVTVKNEKFQINQDKSSRKRELKEINCLNENEYNDVSKKRKSKKSKIKKEKEDSYGILTDIVREESQIKYDKAETNISKKRNQNETLINEIVLEEISLKNEESECKQNSSDKLSKKRKRKEMKCLKELEIIPKDVRDADFSKQFSDSQSILSKVENLLKTEPAIPKHKLKETVKIIELFDKIKENIVKDVAIKSEYKNSVGPLDTSNIQDIKGYKYYYI